MEAPSLDRRLLLAMVISLFVVGLDGSVVNIMLPKLTQLFAAPAPRVMLVASTYLTVMAACQLSAGRCSDLFGAVRMLALGVAVFFGGSAWCAAAPDLYHLLAGRALQGLAGSLISSSVGAVVLTHFPRARTGAVFGSLFMVMGVGTIVGPPLGGFLAERVSWHWAFLLNLPLCLAACVALWPYLREPAGRGSWADFDLWGGLLSAGALASLPAAFSLAAEVGWRSPRVVWLLAVAGSCALGYLVVESRSRKPLLDPRVFLQAGLSLTAALRILLYVAFNGVLVVMPFYLTRVVGLTVDGAGWVSLGSALTMAALTPRVGGWTDRRGPRTLGWVGSLGLAGFGLACLALPEHPAVSLMVALHVVLGTTVSLVMVSSSVHLLKLAPAGREGVFAALNFLLVPVGGALGLSAFSGIYAAGGFQLSMQVVVVVSLTMAGLALAAGNPKERTIDSGSPRP